MIKKILPIVLATMALASCGPKSSSTTSSTNDTSSEIPTSSETTTNDTSSNLPSVNAPTTVSDLYNFIKNTSLNLELIYGTSAQRNCVVGKANLFSKTFETSKETYHSYSDDVLTVSGEIKYEKIPADEWSEPETKNDKFEGISTIVDSHFYQIIDYDNESIYVDSAKKYSVPNEVNEQMIDMYTTNGLSLLLSSHFEKYILNNIVQDNDGINPIKDDNGDFSYTYQLAYNTAMDYETISTVVNFEASFTNYGMIKSYHFKVEENSVSEDWEGNTVTQFVSSINDQFSSLDFNKKVGHTSFNINPLDYYLISYDIQLFSDDLMGGDNSLSVVDANKIPLDTNLVAKVINPQPAKALDTELNIIESSNPNIVKVTTYDGYKSTVKAVGIGNATLTAVSESGIRQTINVSVISKPLESIRVSIYDSSILEGDTVNVYVTRYPEANTDELVASLSCTSDVATITKDDNGDFVINALKPAENVTLTIYSKQNPEIKGECNFKIHKRFTFDEIKESLKNSIWTSNYQQSSATIAFNDDGTGYFMVTNNTSYGSIFVENKKYNFTYTIQQHENGYPGDITMTLSSFVVDSGEYKYNFNDNLVVLDYSMSYLDVRLTPEGESGWMFAFSDNFYLQQN